MFGTGTARRENETRGGQLRWPSYRLIPLAIDTYPILLYFHFRDVSYALPRVAMLTMDTATLIESALDSDKYRTLLRSAAAVEVWGGGLQLLHDLSHSLHLREQRHEDDEEQEQGWRARYERAVARLQAAGIATVPDVESGAQRYIALRRCWNPYISALTTYMAYDWEAVAPADRGTSHARQAPEDAAP